MTTLPERCLQALRYYARETDEYGGMPKDGGAYNTLNALFYDDINSEEARAREGKRLNPAFFDTEPGALPALCTNLIKACVLGGKDAPAETVFRVARRSDVEAMRQAGRTLSFTSTSKNGFLDSYTDKDGLILLELHLPKDAPRAELAALLPDYSKPEEAEVLLPPWLTAEFEECALSEAELRIRDRNGSPPCAKYRVLIGDTLEAPECDANTPLRFPSAKPGKRVLIALGSGETPDPRDIKDYLLWKKALHAEVAAECSLLTLHEIYKESMDSVRYIADNTPNDLFDAAAGRAWIKALLGVDYGSGFARRIDSLPDVRVTHTITTFLLGSWLRDNLRLGFNNLPRIFSRNNKVGDPFPFFWAVVCLGHDIGYCFERDLDLGDDQYLELFRDIYKEWNAGNTELPKLRELLGLHDGKTLLQLDRDDLKDCGLTEKECDWAERSIRMAWKYYGYRMNQKKEDLNTVWTDPTAFRKDYRGRIDHGITGGMVMFDVLREMANRRTDKTAARHEEDGETGYAAANFGHSRFLACGILVALTVARHNMWVVDKRRRNSDDNQKTLYRRSGLRELIVNGKIHRLSIHEPLDQLLYFLDYMDTVDPFKAFYMRRNLGPDEQEKWRQFVMHGIRLGFSRGKTGGDHRIRLCFDTSDFDPDSTSVLKKYIDNARAMRDWLLQSRACENTPDSLDLYLPVTERRSCKNYGHGVTDKEILDICFYQGVPDTSRPGAFYRSPNAYQTINLLMMHGLNGERIRIGMEGQQPTSVYIREWRRTLALFKSIFSALCKCRPTDVDKCGVLHRMDRGENARQMLDAGQTITFTSTTKAAFLFKFLDGKIEPVIETLTLTESVPAFDFQQVLREDYAFTDEAEILLPPFVKLHGSEELPSVTDGVSKLRLTLGDMDFPAITEDKEKLEATLNRCRDDAAKTLDAFVKDAELAAAADENDYPAYLEWKSAFQKLVAIELRGIFSP